MRATVRFMTMVAAGVALAGCGGGSVKQADLDGRLFVGTSVSDATAVPDPSRLTLQFADGEMSETGGCNATGGRYEISDGRLRFSGDAGTTQIGCGTDHQDEWLTALFDDPGADITLSDGGASLKLEHGERSATFGLAGAKDGPAPLEGPQWTAYAFASPQGTVQSITGGMVKPALRIRDGEATIFTGCNSGTASAEVRKDVVRFGDFKPTTHRACRGYVGRIDRIVRGTFSGNVRFGFESARDVFLLKREGLGVHLGRR